MKSIKLTVITSLLCTSVLSSGAAFAETGDDNAKVLQSVQDQVQKLQNQIKDMEKKITAANSKAEAAKNAAIAPAAGKPAKSDTSSKSATTDATVDNGKMKVTLGGFIDATGIFRTKNQTSDTTTNWKSIPFNNNPNSHISESRGSARSSRLSLLAQGNPDQNTSLAAYFETDFQGAASTANSAQTNSYNPRLRQAYATYDRSDMGFHFLAGQAWSLITLGKTGIIARQENIPQTIDSGYTPGFNSTRNVQVRIAKDFNDKKVWAALSLESPQALSSTTCLTSAGTTSTSCQSTQLNSAGGSGFASTNTYSMDAMPDVIAKVAFDPGYGHYEIYGVGRQFRNRTTTGPGTNNDTFGGGGGVGAILPIIPKKLNFQISGLVGRGIGRYGVSQLPDVTTKIDGSLETVGALQALAGFTARATDTVDLYLYAGMEQAQKTADTTSNTGAGYGNPYAKNSGCEINNSATNTCNAETKYLAQVTAGGWWQFYKGSYGKMQVGVQDSFSKRGTFEGLNGQNPSATQNVTMVSFRYYPF